MKTKPSALWFIALILFAATVSTSANFVKRKAKPRKTDVLFAKRLNPNAEADRLFNIAILSDTEDHEKADRAAHARRIKQAAKRRKLKYKAAKMKQANVRQIAFADDPGRNVAVVAILPKAEKASAKSVAFKKSTSRVSRKRSGNNMFPSWIPQQPEAKQKCAKCFRQECPKTEVMRQHCPSGVAKDRCGCCMQCASGVGMPCFTTKYSGIWLPPCGDNLKCAPIHNKINASPESEATRGNKASSEGVCSCKDRNPVCGSNRVTYDNICEFREASSRLRILAKTIAKVSHEGPCKTAPKIDSPPANVVAAVGDLVSFRCETSGFPLARIQWLKKGEKKKKNAERELPGYLNHAVTQLRGGPGKYQLTTWLTLDKAKASDVGTYICRSSNDFGAVDAQATLAVKENATNTSV